MPLLFEAIPVPLHMDETGTVRVANSRVTLDVVLGCYLNGETPEAIAADFPALSAADVHAVVSYYLRHQPQVDAYLDQRKREAQEVRTALESRPETQAFRERLRARKAKLETKRRAAVDHG